MKIESIRVRVRLASRKVYYCVTEIIKVNVGVLKSKTCLVQSCHKKGLPLSSFCFEHWYDFNYNNNRLVVKNGKWNVKGKK